LADERFVERYETVENVPGSNLPLPEGFAGTSSDVSEAVSTAQAITEFAAEQEREPCCPVAIAGHSRRCN